MWVGPGKGKLRGLILNLKQKRRRAYVRACVLKTNENLAFNNNSLDMYM